MIENDSLGLMTDLHSHGLMFAKSESGVITLENNSGSKILLSVSDIEIDRNFIERIVAAYNACEFLPTDQLQKGIVLKLLKGVELSAIAVSQIKDTLAETKMEVSQ